MTRKGGRCRLWPGLVALLWIVDPVAGQSYQDLVDLCAEVHELRLENIDNLHSETFNTRARKIQTLRERLELIDSSAWPISQQVDHLLVRSLLSELFFQHTVTRPWRRDPGFYVDRLQAIVFEFEDLPLDSERRSEARQQLGGVAGVVAAARENLTEATAALARLALRNLREADGVGHGDPYRPVPPAGVVGWYQDLLSRVEQMQPDLAAEAESALDAVRGFRQWLEEQQPEMTGPSGVGLRQYNWYLKNVRLMPFTAAEIRIIGDRELQRSLSLLALEQERNKPVAPLDPAPSAEAYRKRVEEADRQVREFIRERDILTLPDFVGQLEHNAPWIERTGGRRNFWEEVQYRDPRPDHVHAVIPGHRFDALLRERTPHPIRSSFRDSGRIEGWAFYVEEMMLQMGLLDSRPRTRELFLIFQAARAIRNRAEVALHANLWSVEEAAQYMVENIPFMDADVARVDCEIYLRRPGYGISYVMGKIQIEELLADRKKELGERFNLKEFHDQFLSAGWIPISLIRWEMTGLSDEIRMLERP